MTLSSRLLLNPAFGYLWAAQTVSQLGTQVTTVALPLVAVITLQASATEVGLLSTAIFLPFLLLTLPFGVLADRRRRRPLILVTYAVCAGLIGCVPVLSVTHLLRMPLLLAIAFGVGAMTVLFELAYLAYVPTVVSPDELVSANSRLQASYSVAQTAGPGIGGLAVAALGAPTALLLDAGSYLCALLLVARISTRETLTTPSGPSTQHLGGLAEAFRFTFHKGPLRTLVVQAAYFNFFESLIITLLPLYVLRDLGLGSSALGFTLSVGGAGAVVGALASRLVTRTIGLGPALAAGMGMASGALLLLPLSQQGSSAFILLCLALGLYGCGLSIYNVQARSMWQLVTPTALMARATACYRLVSYSTLPAGALAGGLLADAIGLRTTLLIAGIALIVGAVALASNSLVRIRSAGAMRTTVGVTE